MRRVLQWGLIGCLILVTGIGDSVYGAFEFYPGGKYDPKIPTPNTLLGYEIGQQFTPYSELVRYLQALEKASDRVMLTTYGETYEGRTLYLVVISAPENLQALKGIHAKLARLWNPLTLRGEGEAREIANTTPVTVWLGYNIHGNEASGTEAAIQMVYQLAAGTDRDTQAILKNVIVLIDPVQNPDGRARFIGRYKQMAQAIPNPNPDAAEHNQPWPSGRTNHYLFDLNRDWFLLVNPETRGRIQAFLKWTPQVLVDLHEMGSNSTYFFAPPAEPLNPHVPESMLDWWRIFARSNARAFDRFGWSYYTREVFDEFYPGYGVSWPILNGVISMTYEQASSRGLAIERNDGTILSLRDAVWHHFTSSMATLRISAEKRREKLLHYYQLRRSAIEEGQQGPVREYLFIPNRDPGRTAGLIHVLLAQGIEVRRATASFSLRRVHDYYGTRPRAKTFPRGTYLISLAQPQKRLIQTILAPDVAIDEDYLKRARSRMEQGKPPGFYDVTAWSLPLAYDVEAYWSAEEASVAAEVLSKPPQIRGQLRGDRASYAYLFSYHTNNAARALVRLLREKVLVHVARRPFRISGQDFAAGTIVVRVASGPSDLHERMANLAIEEGVTVYSIDTALSESGIDLGSNQVIPLPQPRIGVVVDRPVRSTSYGALWYLLEQVYRLPFTPLPGYQLNKLDLQRYNVLVFPDTPDATAYQTILGETGFERLKRWIEQGGTLVGIKGGAAFAVRAKLTTAKLLGEGEQPRENKPIQTPGAILRVNLSDDHLLTLGYDAGVPVPVYSDLAFAAANPRHQVAGYAEQDKLRISGFIWPEAARRLAGTTYLLAQRCGRGQVILFADDPNFRGTWKGLERLFLNSLLFAPAGNQRSR